MHKTRLKLCHLTPPLKKERQDLSDTDFKFSGVLCWFINSTGLLVPATHPSRQNPGHCMFYKGFDDEATILSMFVL